MDTSTTPRISSALDPETMTALMLRHVEDREPETMAALMLRYVEDREETAYQYARALVRHFAADLSVHDALRLARIIVTDATNGVQDFEGEEVASRIGVALQRLLDRVEAELAD